VLDDAHLAGHAVVQLLRDLHRQAGAVLLMSRPTGTTGPRPDPLDCLLYEAGVRFLPVPPLDAEQTHAILDSAVGGPVHPATAAALHAATGGNPGLLRDLVIGGELAASMVHHGGTWQLPADPGRRLELTEAGRQRVLGALHQAWRAMSFDRLGELCQLALGVGATEQTAPILAFALLLRGQATEGLRLLDALDLSPADEAGSASLVLTRAALLAFGAGRIDAAADLLAEAAGWHARTGPRLLAVRAWVLATTGRTGQAAVALRDIGPTGDPAAEVFTRAAVAGIELAADRPKVAVSHLRRAIIGAEALRTELPWLPPYLTGVLIDALLLAGRINEATAAAADFHAAHEGCGWDVTVSLSALVRSVAAMPDRGVTASRRDVLAR
jgi:hypothetical protein